MKTEKNLDKEVQNEMCSENLETNDPEKYFWAKRLFYIFYIIGFLLIIALPVFTINRIDGLMSDTENRYLASFPAIFNQDGTLSDSLKDGFESWLSDNIGLRSHFVELAATIKVKVFHQSTSEKVVIGRDGWYFYTLDNNLEIASGEYPLTETMLKEIADMQQAISDYYKSNGVEYILALTPSKASVYPEYIGGANYTVGSSPCDIVEEYLNEHTDVCVVNLKTANVAAKEESQQFLKTDTHWTQQGSYTAYCALLEKLNARNVVQAAPVKVQFSEDAVRGEFSAMLGARNILPLETVPIAQWEQHAEQVKDGEWFDSIEKLCKQNADAKPYETIVLKNPAAQDNTMLIYGDSQWMVTRKLPLLLAEHFGNVVSIRMRSPNIEMDQAVIPDVVVFTCSERQINSILRRNLAIPKLVDEVPEVFERPAQTADYWIGTNGICIETYNGTRIQNAEEITLDTESSVVTLVGWAGDFNEQKPLDALYLQIGDMIIQCNYGIEKPAVVQHFQSDSLKNTGFSISFPISYLQNEEKTELQFILIGPDGTYRYEPVTYYLLNP